MNKIILVKLGELWLKGRNRSDFINRLISNIVRQTGVSREMITCRQGRIYIAQTSESKSLTVMLERVFGIHSFVEAVKLPRELSAVKKELPNLIEERIKKAKTFRVETNRADKSFSQNSNEVSAKVGEWVLEKYPDLKVDLDTPDLTINVEVRKEGIFLYLDKDEVSGPGGLPVGSSDRALLLLSGGIDSPVAGWLALKRGIEVDAVYFHSPPYTGGKAKEKVRTLAEKLAEWKGAPVRLHVPRFTDIQVTTTKDTPNGYWTLLHRRLMMLVAQEIALRQSSGQAKERGYTALITGESVGQVSSQTLPNMAAVSYGLKLPVLRPLVTYDKQETVELSKKADLYETSILPFEDCCTVFASDNPKTRVNKDELLDLESKFDVDAMIGEAIGKMEVF